MRVDLKAPSFEPTAACLEGEIIKLSLDDFEGKWIILFFYPRDFTSVCPTELHALARHHKQFVKEGAQVIAVSTDDAKTHVKWLAQELPEVKFPILADTTHEISAKFRVLDEDHDTAQRAAFIIDPRGIIRYIVISDMDVGRNIEELLRVLQALKTGALCPFGWKKGDKPLKAKIE